MTPPAPNPEPSPDRLHLSRASQHLLAIGAAFLLVMIVAIVSMTWRMHDDALSDARQNLDKLAIAVAEQTSRAVQSADIVMEQLRAEIKTRGATTPELFRSVLGSEPMHAALVTRLDSLSQLDAITIIGADGRLVNYSRQWPIQPTNLSDRDYYQYFLQHDDLGAFISRPVQNRDNQEWTVYLVRRVNGPDGTFLGMVLASLRLPYFEDFYRSLTAESGNSVTLLRRDGTVLTSYPATGNQGLRMLPNSPWHGAVEAGAGNYTAMGVITPGEKIISVRSLNDYPLVVNVAQLTEAALAGWRRMVILAVAVTASAVACVLLLLRALFLQLRRLERSEASLARQNAELESTQQRLEFQAAALSESQAHLARESTALETTLGHMGQGIMMVTADLVVQVCNRQAMEMLDLPPEFMATRPSFADVVQHQKNMREFAHLPADAPGTIGAARIVDKPTLYERRRPNGRILEIQSVPLADGGMVRTYTDITERRRSEEQVRYLAHHDGLTRLVNRSVFQSKLDEAIELAARSMRGIAVHYLDLDGFKLVNDTYGHGVGDKLLIEVADRLRSVVREIDTVARMGGDEFAVIQPLVDSPGGCEALAIRILAAMTEPYIIGEIHCRVGLSIGIALYPDHAATSEELLRDADIALYRAKAGGKGMFSVFDQAMDLYQQRLAMLEHDLAQAVADGQFFLEYQPILETNTLETVGFEALVRWEHPTRGLIGPAEFISLAEASGQIVPLGLWVLESACLEARNWPPQIRLSVNLSPMQFKRNDLPDQIAAVLDRTGFDPKRLNLEVTEGLLLDDTAAVLDAMFRLRQSGVSFSLDDFGTAHSGLAYLRRFPFDVLKIDKSFVQDAAEHADARAIVAAVLAIGAAFGLTVTAEGVETEAQLAMLREMGCAQLQGFLTGRPARTARIQGRIAAYAR